MTTHQTFASAALVACLAFGAASRVPAQETVHRSGGGFGLLRDPKFRDGFLIDAPKPGQHTQTGLIQQPSASGKPSWHLCQWNSRFDLAKAKPESLDEGTTRYANEAKSVVLGSGSRYKDLVLSLDSRPEFGGTARKINHNANQGHLQQGDEGRILVLGAGREEHVPGDYRQAEVSGRQANLRDRRQTGAEENLCDLDQLAEVRELQGRGRESGRPISSGFPNQVTGGRVRRINLDVTCVTGYESTYETK